MLPRSTLGNNVAVVVNHTIRSINYNGQWILVRTHETDKKPIIIGNYYVPCDNTTPGNKTKRKSTIASIRSNVARIRSNWGDNCRIMLCGDFNLHMSKQDNDELNPLIGNHMFDDNQDGGGREMRDRTGSPVSFTKFSN